jgi:uncharacterized membrane protein YbhN (UPF0104 family)
VTVAVTVSLLGWLALQVDFDELLNHLRTARPWWWVAAIAAQSTTTLFMAYRWQKMLAVDGANLPYSWCLGVYLRSTFVGLFLPSALGGDVYRGIAVSTAMGSARAIAVNLLTERFIGLSSICLLAIAGVSVGSELPGPIVPAVVVAATSIMVVLVLLASATPASQMSKVLSRLGLNKMASRVEAVSTQLRGHLGTRGFFGLLGISVGQQLAAVAAVYACGLATDVSLGFAFYLATVPIIWILSLIPSIAGTGPREAGLFEFLTIAGIGQSQAAACVALVLGTIVVRGLLGGLAFVVWRPSTVDLSSPE